MAEDKDQNREDQEDQEMNPKLWRYIVSRRPDLIEVYLKGATHDAGFSSLISQLQGQKIGLKILK